MDNLESMALTHEGKMMEEEAYVLDEAFYFSSLSESHHHLSKMVQASKDRLPANTIVYYDKKIQDLSERIQASKDRLLTNAIIYYDKRIQLREEERKRFKIRDEKAYQRFKIRNANKPIPIIRKNIW